MFFIIFYLDHLIKRMIFTLLDSATTPLKLKQIANPKLLGLKEKWRSSYSINSNIFRITMMGHNLGVSKSHIHYSTARGSSEFNEQIVSSKW